MLTHAAVLPGSVQPPTRHASGLQWIMRPATDDHLGPGHEGALDALVRVPEGGILLDVGAHVGHFSLRAARAAKLVVAFEPGPVQREGLLKNLDLNAITNVRVVPKAAWSRPTRLAIRTGEDGNFGRSSVYELENGTIDATTLDAEAADLPRVDLVKIDVQGAEGRVLEGARETLRRHTPRLVLELHDREYHDPGIRQRVEDNLRAAGYVWTQVHSNKTNDYLYCVPKGREEELPAAVRAARKARMWENVRLAPERVYLGAKRRIMRLGA